MRVGKEYDLPLRATLSTPRASSSPRSRPGAGIFVKDADPLIIDDLRGARAAATASSSYTHTYPFCWRCDTPLLYYAKTSWFIRTTRGQGAAAGRTTRRSTGTRSTSRTGASATGSRTTSTGRSAANATGARRCRSGSASEWHTSTASAAWPSLARRLGPRAGTDAGPAPALRRRGRLPVPEVRRRR